MSVFLQSLGVPRAEIDQRLRAPRVMPPQRGRTAITAQLHAMAVHSQQDTAALPASRPFAVGQAGYDYFADDQHYRSLADRVLAGLRQGGRIVLVTAGGDGLERTRLWSRLMSTPADPGAPRAPVNKRRNNPMRRPDERISVQRKVRQHQCICIE